MNSAFSLHVWVSLCLSFACFAFGFAVPACRVAFDIDVRNIQPRIVSLCKTACPTGRLKHTTTPCFVLLFLNAACPHRHDMHGIAQREGCPGSREASSALSRVTMLLTLHRICGRVSAENITIFS